MPLPTITTPTYELELPVTKKTVKYRQKISYNIGWKNHKCSEYS